MTAPEWCGERVPGTASATCHRYAGHGGEHASAALGVGHAWTEVACPAYRTAEPADCTCQAVTMPTTHTQTPHEEGPDYCEECSRAIREWVRWPCDAASPPGKRS